MGDPLHPYDGGTRRYQHTNLGADEGLRVVMDLLHLGEPPPPEGVMFDLSFHSGGMGAVDKVAITVPVETAPLAPLLAGLQAKTAAEAVADADWSDDFLWLVQDEDDPLPVQAAAARFINENRRPFQPECRATDRTWFEVQSNVNHWTAIWESDATLSYLAYDQG